MIASGGRDAFYDGPIARSIVADLETHGSSINTRALADYKAEDATIVRGEYRGYELIGTDIPSAGAMTIHALQIMEHFDPGAMLESEWFAVTGQALGYALDELANLGSDTASARVTSKEWAAMRADQIATPLNTENANLIQRDEYLDNEVPINHTTHFSVADEDGMFI
jgi:gamma-glutamyltranspeptidase/glutathione hydrolase